VNPPPARGPAPWPAAGPKPGVPVAARSRISTTTGVPSPTPAVRLRKDAIRTSTPSVTVPAAPPSPIRRDLTTGCQDRADRLAPRGPATPRVASLQS